MTTEKKVIDAVEKVDSNLIHLSTGVVLKGKQANPLALIKVMAGFPRPKPPVIMIEAMGREMENTDDPDYINRVESWEVEKSNATLNALILLGTELMSVPKGMPRPEDDAWLDEYKVLGIEIMPHNKSWRYLNWVTYKAVGGRDDLNKVQEVVGRLSGVTEADVKTAETFPGSN